MSHLSNMDFIKTSKTKYNSTFLGWHKSCPNIYMKKSILVIEENTIELRKLRKILSIEGFEIMTVTDYKTAEDICKKIEVSYVLGTRSAWNINTMHKSKQ